MIIQFIVGSTLIIIFFVICLYIVQKSQRQIVPEKSSGVLSEMVICTISFPAATIVRNGQAIEENENKVN